MGRTLPQVHDRQYQRPRKTRASYSLYFVRFFLNGRSFRLREDERLPRLDTFDLPIDLTSLFRADARLFRSGDDFLSPRTVARVLTSRAMFANPVYRASFLPSSPRRV